MNQWQFVAVFLGLLFSISLSSQTVEIPDACLEMAIRHNLKKPVGEITVADMESLTELDASLLVGRQLETPRIRSLEGIESAVNLTLLDLSGLPPFLEERAYIDVVDFSSLANLSKLRTLDLGSNYLQVDFTVPTGLISLTTLTLSQNRLTGLTLPNDMTSVVELNLQGNDLSTLLIPAEYSELERLFLSGNRFSYLGMN